MIDLEDVAAAARRIAPHAHETPVFTSRALSELAGAELFFKCENFQRVGAFKFRGACNAVLSLGDDEARPGVATHSSGNHAQAVALAAQIRGVTAHIVMPENAPAVKVAAVREYGGAITFCEPTLASRESTLRGGVAETGSAVVHPYDDDRVIAGQGTAALELLGQVDGLDVVCAPVGGGGLISGTAITVKALLPEARVVAAEPEAADDAFRSMKAGRIVPSVDPQTISDGLRTSLGRRNFAIMRAHDVEVVTVSEAETAGALRLVLERMKLLIEPSSAVPVAAALAGRLSRGARNARIGIILTGGNVDIERLSAILEVNESSR
ncbi:MAG: pyridoxal-phosphate dependent enzyme [Deltaproteobacteria bacterium]|nr:pyridoxal-phosphate dependent enzyme [Deltaproteobacteria bacterium]